MNFDPNATGTSDSGIFGLPFSYEESRLVLLPVPWEVTTSYGSGASYGPDAIFACSKQLDLVHKDTGRMYEHGIYWHTENKKRWKKLNDTMKSLAQKIIELRTEGKKLDKNITRVLEDINEQNESFQDEVYTVTKTMLEQGKLVGLVGGDHSCPLGSIRAHSEKYNGDYSIIHVDAHADLRIAYQGFQQSHASIMRNVMTRDFAPKKLVQLGIRDYSPEENEFIESRTDIKTYFDTDIKRYLYSGKSWQQFCEEMLQQIPTKNVYLSFDIDGLSPIYGPSTGTPVPGGLDFCEIIEMLFQITKNGKKIIGFDLCEVAPESPNHLDGWDGNVGSRVLYNMCCYTLFTNV